MPARADDQWAAWCKALVMLAAEAPPDIAAADMPARLAEIATLTLDPRSRCADDFKVAASGPVARGYALALGTGETACDGFHFGLLDLTLMPRSAKDMADLRKLMTERFGTPSSFNAGPGRRTDHWQVAELRSVELQYDIRLPGIKAGVAVSNIPSDVAVRRRLPKPGD